MSPDPARDEASPSSSVSQQAYVNLPASPPNSEIGSHAQVLVPQNPQPRGEPPCPNPPDQPQEPPSSRNQSGPRPIGSWRDQSVSTLSGLVRMKGARLKL